MPCSIGSFVLSNEETNFERVVNTLARRIDHREATDFALHHQNRRVNYRSGLANGHDLAGHDARHVDRRGKVAVSGDEQIALGDDPDEHSSFIYDRQAADPMFLHQPQRALEVGILGNGDRRGTHVLVNIHRGSFRSSARGGASACDRL